MDEFKLIVAGGRTFNDFIRLSDVINTLANTVYDKKAVSIVSGMAGGADRLGYKFAKDNGIVVYEFPADWARHSRSAGYIRNVEMGTFANGLLAFWDGESRGTKHMIDYMRSLGKPVHVIQY